MPNLHSGDYEFRVIFRSKVNGEPRYWTPWPAGGNLFTTLADARAAQLTLEGLRSDCDIKIQAKLLPQPWLDLETAGAR